MRVPVAGEHLQVSYLTLRRVVGILGVSLPIIVVVWHFALCGCTGILSSISEYYQFRTRDALVGIMFTISWFLFTYRGYDRVDDYMSDLACIFGLGETLFRDRCHGRVEQIVHYVCTVGFFLVLAYFALFLFTKSSGEMTPRKRVRNRVYRTCGVIMLVCLVLIGVDFFFLVDVPAVEALHPIFWLEAIGLWAFGFSWFVKGETLWKDASA